MVDKRIVDEWLKQADEDFIWAEASLREEVWKGACFAA